MPKRQDGRLQEAKKELTWLLSQAGSGRLVLELLKNRAFSTRDLHYVVKSFAYASTILVNHCSGESCNSSLNVSCLQNSSGGEENSY